MNDFDPGPGWREVPVGEMTAGDLVLYEHEDAIRRWVREETVPPLPTEPYTVIRVTWHKSQDGRLSDLLVRRERDIWSAVEVDQWFTHHNLEESITGFEVLARPVGKVLAEGEDAYYDSHDIAAAERRGYRAALSDLRAKRSFIGRELADELDRDSRLEVSS